MKHQIKNVILIIILFILMSLGMSKVSNAEVHQATKEEILDKLDIDDDNIMGRDFYLSGKEEKEYKNLFCVEHGQGLPDTPSKYTVASVVVLNGNKIRDKKAGETYTISKENNEDLLDKTLNLEGALHYATNAKSTNVSAYYSKLQQAIWYYMPKWANEYDKYTKNKEKKFDYSEFVGDKEEGTYKALTRRLKLYRQRIKNEGNEKPLYVKFDYTDREDNNSSDFTLKDPGAKINDEEYPKDIRVGPYRLQFQPDIDEEFTFEIYAKILGDKDEIDLMSLDMDTGEKVRFLSDGAIYESFTELESDKAFYILIPKSMNVEEITKIHVETGYRTVLDITNIRAQIVFLKASKAQWQNFVVVKTKTDSTTKEGEDKADNTCKVKLTRDLTITKKVSGSNITLDNIAFKLWSIDLQKYVICDPQGTCMGFDGEGSTLYTNSAGERTIYKLPLGHYQFVESDDTKQIHKGFEFVGPNRIDLQGTIHENGKMLHCYWTAWNKQVRIKLSGRVWNDGYEGKATVRDNLYGNGELGIGGIEVQLLRKESTGTYISATTYTNNDRYILI